MNRIRAQKEALANAPPVSSGDAPLAPPPPGPAAPKAAFKSSTGPPAPPAPAGGAKKNSHGASSTAAPAPPPPAAGVKKAPYSATGTYASTKAAAPAAAPPKAATVISNDDKAWLIKNAESYLKPIYTDFHDRQGFLEDVPKDKWETGIFVDWDAILSDPLFLKKYPDPTAILGPVRSTKTTQGFHTSMTCWANTMRECCTALNTPERNAITSVKKFVITLNMSLPVSIEPDFKWDDANKILTTVHNPLSFIDGVQDCYYKVGEDFHPGGSSNWWPGLWWVMNDNYLPYMKWSKNVRPTIEKDGLICCSGFNLAANPQLAQPFNQAYDDYKNWRDVPNRR